MKLSDAAKRTAEQAKDTHEQAEIFKGKLEAALAGAKVNKTNLEEYLKTK